jgi:hypothetical protein
VLNPGKVIIDLTGLNETELARHGFSTRLLFGRYDPDLIYMPNNDYVEMWKSLTTAPEFAGYELVPRSKGLSLALHRNSRYYDAMQRIVKQP